MTNATILRNPKNGETLECKMSDDEAVAILSDLESDFAQSLATKFNRNPDRISEAQLYWVHKLANDSLRPKLPTSVAIEPDLYDALKAMFANAKEHIKYPKLTFGSVVLSVATQRSQRPGSINVVVDRQWFGRIDKAEFQPSFRCDQSTLELINELTANPADYAAKYGKATGNCCCCGRELTDPRSCDAGIGPVCAKNWGIPWG